MSNQLSELLKAKNDLLRVIDELEGKSELLKTKADKTPKEIANLSVEMYAARSALNTAQFHINRLITITMIKVENE